MRRAPEKQPGYNDDDNSKYDRNRLTRLPLISIMMVVTNNPRRKVELLLLLAIPLFFFYVINSYAFTSSSSSSKSDSNDSVMSDLLSFVVPKNPLTTTIGGGGMREGRLRSNPKTPKAQQGIGEILGEDNQPSVANTAEDLCKIFFLPTVKCVVFFFACYV
jgi:hypothetical protein